MAVALTGAYAESIPNFELLTVSVFLGGALLGARDGAAVGALSALGFSLLNPYGPAHPAVTLSQSLAQSITGAAGGFLARIGIERRPRAVQVAIMAAAGVGVTLLYDVLTNLATGLVYGQLGYWLLAGIPFSLWHMLGNLALFAAVGVPLLGVMARFASRL